MANAVCLSVEKLEEQSGSPLSEVLTLDGRKDFNDAQLTRWNNGEREAVLREAFPEQVDQILSSGILCDIAPTFKDISAAESVIGYAPQFGHRDLFHSLGTMA